MMPGKDEPSPEQMLAMLEELQRQGHKLDDISPDLSALLRNVKKEKGQPTEDFPTEEITPEPGFVIKTSDTASDTKVFINVCSSHKVPAPGNGWANGAVPEEVQKALEQRDGAQGGGDAEALRFPLSAGQPKHDIDKKGQACMTIDCILNTDVVKQAAAFRPLKSFLIELSMGWIGHKTKMTLDAKYKLPKMRYKGETVEKQVIRVDRKPLVCEVQDLPEEPSFPLVTKKPKQPLQQLQQQQQQGAGSSAQSASTSAAAAGPSARPSELKPSSVYPPTHAASRHVLKHTVEYVKVPVEEVLVTVQLPEGAGSGAPGPGSLPQVEVSGRSVFVSSPGCEELHVQLPLAVSVAGGSGAELDVAQGQLRLRLQYLPLGQYIEQMRQEKPLAFGQLGLGMAGLLELE